jgi:hypothetical protein
MPNYTDAACTEPSMTALADPPVNGAEPAAKPQSSFVRPVSAASSRNDASEQAAVRVTRAAAVLITVVIAVASFVLSFSSLWNWPPAQRGPPGWRGCGR